MYVGAIDAAGNSGGADVVATRPPTADPFTPIKLSSAKESTTWYYSALTAESWWYGKVISGTGLYAAEIRWDGVEPEPVVTTHRIGGGWDRFTADRGVRRWLGEQAAQLLVRAARRRCAVPLEHQGGFRALGSYPGFASVKTMAIISETGTYDTCWPPPAAAPSTPSGSR